jgi:hypothetical protein
MYTGPLLTYTQPTCNRQGQSDTLNEQCRKSQEPFHHEPRNNALHLTNPTARRIRRKTLDQACSRETKHACEYDVQQVVQRPEAATPALPLGTSALGAPTAETLVEIECSRTVPQFDVAQPLGHDVEESGVQADRCADKRNYNPRLACIVCFGDLASPDTVASA